MKLSRQKAISTLQRLSTLFKINDLSEILFLIHFLHTVK